MAGSKKRFALLLAVSIGIVASAALFQFGSFVSGCGGNDNSNSDDPVADEGSDLDSLWGIDDEVESKFVYLKEMNQRGKVRVEKGDSALVIRDGLNSVTAELSSDGESYFFEATYRGVNLKCSIALGNANAVDMTCDLNGVACRYSMVFKGDGYEAAIDDCSEAFNEMAMTSSPGAQKSAMMVRREIDKALSEEPPNPWSYGCGRYNGSEPAVCSNVVSRDGIKYYYRTSCTDERPDVSASNGVSADYSNVLRLLRVYSEDEKEGCFLFICNGPHGNLHMVIMPYNKSLIEEDDVETAKNIRDAENEAPVVLHTLLPGAYEKDNQCEWYETNSVGYQDIHYNNKVVWDWDNFCIGGRCPYKLMYVVYESDEERMNWITELLIRDDMVGYGVVRRGNTLDYENTFYAPKFKMAFRTGDAGPPSGGEFVNEGSKIEFVNIPPFGLQFGQGFQGVNKLYPDPLDENIVWVSAFNTRSYSFPAYRLLKWDHRGTLLDPSDDEIIDFTASLTEGGSMNDNTTLGDITADGNGGLWFATNLNGITHVDVIGNWTRHIDLFDSGSSTVGPWAIEMGLDGNVYVGANGFVAKYDDAGWTRVVENAPGVKTIAVGADGKLWFGPYYAGVYSLDSNGNLAQQDFFWEEGLNEGWVVSMLIESPDRIWFGTMDDGLYEWNVRENTTRNINYIFTERPFTGPWIKDIHLDGKGRLWLATGEGVAFIDRELVPHSFGYYKPNSNMETIMEDGYGRFLFGSLNGLYLMVEKPE